MVCRSVVKTFLFVFLVCAVSVSEAAEESKPLWEYGFGAGYAQYAHYPAADQYAQLFLPFPTFQYRGEILRADDREGGRAYLLKNEKWSLEFSGSGSLPLDSSDNRAREGMDNLPLVLEAGPQLVYSQDHDWEFKIAVFPSVVIDGAYVRQNGGSLNLQAAYRWEKEVIGPFATPLGLSGILTLNAKAASQEFHKTYFEVSSKDATSTRSQYDAVAGFLDTQATYFQRISKGRFTLYAAVSYTDYSQSVNRTSPLHRADSNFEYGVGLTYVLGESKRQSVPLENTEGLINKAIQHRKERLEQFQ
ncbi:MipA/OmpV family protein [Bdellovibrio sp. HCB-162]|uniref:MipA/OmpV family protein n=1 Tax=Bdellovibrio sp. HCB-162 TaxID=3394234 RepID=UPI0039BD333E